MSPSVLSRLQIWWLIDWVQALRQLHSAALTNANVAATLAAALAAVRDAALQPTGSELPLLPTHGHAPAPALVVQRTCTSEGRHQSILSALFWTPISPSRVQ